MEVHPVTHLQHSKHHVIIVDEEDQLFLSVGKLSRHPQDKVLHLSLQCRQTSVHLECDIERDLECELECGLECGLEWGLE